MMESLQDSLAREPTLNTESELARQTRIPPATISNVLAGRRNIRQQNAVRLGDYFGVSPVAFLAAAGKAI